MPLANSRTVHPRFLQEIRRSAVADLGLPDECTIVRPAPGQGTVDADSGRWTPPAGQPVFTGPCRLQSDPRARPKNADTTDELLVMQRYKASLPWDAPQVLVDDVLTVTRTHDPQLAGRPFVVRDVKYDTFQVRRFLDLEEHPDHPTPEGA